MPDKSAIVAKCRDTIMYADIDDTVRIGHWRAIIRQIISYKDVPEMRPIERDRIQGRIRCNIEHAIRGGHHISCILTHRDRVFDLPFYGSRE